MSSQAPVDVFIAYSQADAPLLERLRIQLKAVERIGLIDAWHDGEIQVGSDREAARIKALSEAEIILLLVSADFIASEFSYEKEILQAMQLHQQKKAVVIPIILKDCAWEHAPFAQLKVLPENGIPVNNKHWQNPDQAFQQVVKAVADISKQFKAGVDIDNIQVTIEESITTTTQHKKTITVSKTGPVKPKKSSSSFWKYASVGLLVLSGLVWMFIPKDNQQNPSQGHEPQTTTTKQSSPSSPAETTSSNDPPPKPSKLNRTKLPFISINGLDWMTQNLNLPMPERTWCPDNQENNCTQYGRHYLFATAQTACPQGWRLPSKKEWQVLLETASFSRLNLQASGLYDKGTRDFKQKGYYWSSDRSGGGEAWCFEFSPTNTRVERRYVHWGMTCRCVAETQ